MAFIKKTQVESNYDTIESLFRDNRTKKISALYSHQAEILKSYQKDYFKAKNLALELPTGSGKTLIGLLIGEFLRRTRNEKILFLCSTNQLVNQVVELSNEKYSINATAFMGRAKDYLPQSKSAYLTANTIAVTNYSSLFNSNPFFKDPDIIIFDDAHVAENYIASNWSLLINRIDEKFYKGLLSILKGSLEYIEFVKLNEENPDPTQLKSVHLIPTQNLYALKDQIFDFLNQNLDSTQNADLYYTWQNICNHFLACQLYVSWKSILIRPIIPPTFEIPAFNNAKQKIFMSATLGSGGDLERILGLKRINRIPLPEGWEKQGAGRRFFVFPDMAMNGEEKRNLYIESNKLFKRSLTIVPDRRKLNVFKAIAEEILQYKVFDVLSIEKSKKSFIETEKAIALIANRYEGIDFEGEECRLLFLINLPRTVNLQETFLFQRMGSMVVLLDRIRTRIIQAIGRCTRGASDYACVIIIGEDVSGYFIDKKFRKYFHPELQAEISFGITQSQDGKLSNILENIGLFIEQGKDWKDVEKEIFEERDKSKQENIAGFTELFSSVQSEIDYQSFMWNHDYSSAVTAAQNAINKLSSCNALNGYRGFWNYLASVASFLAFKEHGLEEYANKTNEFLTNASNSSRSITWLRKLSILNFSQSEVLNIWDIELASNIERLDSVFTDAGVTSTTRFEKEMVEIQNGILSNDASLFEPAQVMLGKYLGFDSKKDSRSGAPDPLWISNNKICIVFEDYTDNKNGTIPISKARQAKAHYDWIIHNIPDAENMNIYCVLISDANKLDPGALGFSKNVFYWQLESFRIWAKEALLTIRQCRSSYVSGNEAWSESVMELFVKSQIDPKSIVDKATQIPLETL